MKPTDVDDLLFEVGALVDGRDLEAAVAACRRLNARLAAGADLENPQEARQHVTSLISRLTLLRNDLRADLKSARRQRTGVSAYQQEYLSLN